MDRVRVANQPRRTGPTSEGPRPAERLVAALDRGWDLLISASGPAVAIGLLLLVVLRSGIALGRSDLHAVLVITDAFPHPVLDWRSNSVLPYAVAHVVHVTEPWQWFLLHGAMTVALVAVLAASLRSRFATTDARRMAAVWLVVGSLGPVLLQRIGSYDVYTALGVVLIVLWRRSRLALLGGILIGLTSAEQGALGLVSALAVLAVLDASEHGASEVVGRLRSSPLARRLGLGLAGVVGARALVLGWFAVQGAHVPSRGSMMGSLLGQSLRNAVGTGGAGIYAWFGLGWGLVLVGWLVCAWRPRVLVGVLAALVVPAALATMTTIDGTRVFVMVSLPAFLVLLGWVIDRVGTAPTIDAQLIRRITIAVLVVAPIAPALIAEPSGSTYFVFPWAR